jgi:hypothetical protein
MHLLRMGMYCRYYNKSTKQVIGYSAVESMKLTETIKKVISMSSSSLEFGPADTIVTFPQWSAMSQCG